MEKATRFVYANRSITFVFCRTDQKKRAFKKQFTVSDFTKFYRIFDFLVIATSFNTF